MARIKENNDYVVSGGAVVLDNTRRFLEYKEKLRQRQREKEELATLKSEVSELKEMVAALMKPKPKPKRKAPAKKKAAAKKETPKNGS